MADMTHACHVAPWANMAPSFANVWPTSVAHYSSSILCSAIPASGDKPHRYLSSFSFRGVPSRRALSGEGHDKVLGKKEADPVSTGVEKCKEVIPWSGYVYILLEDDEHAK